MTLRLVLDEGISREVMRQLAARSHRVDHALDLGLKSRPDPEVFLAAQKRQATLCTSNRGHFEMLVIAWLTWGLGAHYGLVVPRRHTQPTPSEWVQALTQIDRRGATLINPIVYI